MHNFYKMRDASMIELFNKIAYQYEQWRMTYPPELYKEIFSSGNEFGTVLEIGTGTGKATKIFLERGIDVTAIEPSAEMLNIACQKFSSFPNFHPLQISFENFFDNGCRQTFDLVFAASSFQWLKGDDRLKMISALIKKGGMFARFKTITILQSNSSADKILDDLYRNYLPDFLPKDTAHTSFNEQIYHAAGFGQVIKKNFFRPVHFRRDDYISFSNTYTEYLSLPKNIRNDFEAAIKSSISEKDCFHLQQKCTLLMAHKMEEEA